MYASQTDSGTIATALRLAPPNGAAIAPGASREPLADAAQQSCVRLAVLGLVALLLVGEAMTPSVAAPPEPAPVFTYPLVIQARAVDLLAKETFPLVSLPADAAVDRIEVEYQPGSNSGARVLLPRLEAGVAEFVAWVYIPKHSELRATVRGFSGEPAPAHELAQQTAELERLRKRAELASPQDRGTNAAHLLGLLILAISAVLLVCVLLVGIWLGVRRLARRTAAIADDSATAYESIGQLVAAHGQSARKLGWVLRGIRVESIQKGQQPPDLSWGGRVVNKRERKAHGDGLAPGWYAVLSDGEREAWAKLRPESAALLRSLLAAFPKPIDRFEKTDGGQPVEGGKGRGIGPMADSRLREGIQDAVGTLISHHLFVVEGTPSSRRLEDEATARRGEARQAAALDTELAPCLGAMYSAALVQGSATRVGLSPHLYVPHDAGEPEAPDQVAAPEHHEQQYDAGRAESVGKAKRSRQSYPADTPKERRTDPRRMFAITRASNAIKRFLA